MTFPVESPLGGVLGATTCSVYRLDPSGTVPLEPVPDLVPGVFTPFRVTLDVVDNEQLQSRARVTQHPVQDFLDVTSNVHIELEVLSVSGVLGASLKQLPFGGPTPPGAFARLDLLRVGNLKKLQRARQPLMVVTPRQALARCFLADLVTQWATADGEQTQVQLTFIEARIASPIMGSDVAQDYPEQTPGANAKTGGGHAPTTAAQGGATADPTPGVAPAYPQAVGLPPR